MTTEQLIELLTESLLDYDSMIDDVNSVLTFADAGLLTSNDGLVLRMADGSEFQLTVVQSRDAS